MQRLARQIGIWAGLIVALFSLALLLGWKVGLDRMIQLIPGSAPIQFNAVLSFAILGLGLGWPFPRRRAALLACGGGVLALASLSFVQYATGASFGIDQLFLRAYIVDATSHPGRMAPNTAVAFIAGGFGLILLGSDAFRGRRPGLPTAIAGSVVLGLGITALVGYASGVENAYGWGRFTQMALQAAIGFHLVGFSLLALAWASATSEDEPIPSWLPLPLLVTGLVITAAVWQALAAESRAQISGQAETQATAAIVHVREQLEQRIEELGRMADRWSTRGGTPFEEWERDAALYVDDSPLYQALEWVNRDFHVTWIVPMAGNEAAVGLELPSESRRRGALEKSRATGRPAVSRVIDLKQGPKGFLVYIPIGSGDAFDGFILGVLRIDGLLAIIENDLQVDGYSFALYDGESPIVLAGRQLEVPSERQSALSVELDVDRYDLPWRLLVWPSAARLDRRHRTLPFLVLWSGIAASILLAFTAAAVIAAQRQRFATEVANRQLVREVEQRKRAERLLEDKAAELEASNQELEQFASVASHDMKEPLRMVAGYTQLLSDRYKGQLDEEADEFIAYAVDGATRMQQLIADLLDYSRVGSVEVSRATIDTDELLVQVKQDLSVAIEQSEGEVIIDPLPDVGGDAGQIGRVFLNLIGNALKFRAPGRPPRVAVSAERQNGAVLFRVIDNGIGMDPNHTDRVFQIFKRLHGRSSYEGTGIGLAISKKIVERHGGRIWCESALDAGTTFLFTLPEAGAESGPTGQPNG